MQNKQIIISAPGKSVLMSNSLPLVFIAGPCAMEGRDFALRTALELREIFEAAGVDFIYKSSFDKANRTSSGSFRGVGMDEGLDILAEVREKAGVPVITDVHSPEQAAPVAAVVDMLQTPAFLCRQTDLIRAVAATGKPVNIKKGQFLAPWDMKNVLSKALEEGNEQIALCERGASFGYGNLVVDMRSFAIMAETGQPVVFDVTHSVQLPGGLGSSSGGQRHFVPTLARAGVAAGVAALFMEVHPDPDKAPCDGPNMIPFSELPKLLRLLKEMDALAKGL
ncbi:2-dehydro-3-deoxyphosphooctonate aldolase [Desulfocurvibacter africanus subsp. africanus str. Walvis Bay]|uniref:2-dehydro-3-deoxyphosphooctonate aldolase n=2 Tax=Desulfocurvibacter africanus TaxID=873 RepID=F3YU14_DESAF|nr:3-deoxy-8-phosphooctulonate synthase [Desulfocurvibacter africanus]EGJ48620.1 2-dehydro-3-deoxyphosphooctonate aldolase [Desulfocurvibacter africanus subsp. africanus str. Walvis Bay]